MTRINFMNNTDFFKNGLVPKSFSEMIDNLVSEVTPHVEKALSFRPRVDVLEKETSYELQVLLPGLGKEDIKVEVEDNKLTISGERKKNTEEGVKYHLNESLFGKFSRSFNLPKNADKEHIEARFENGILYLGMQKLEPQKSGRVIDII